MKKLISIINILVLFCGYSVYMNQWVSPSVTPFFEYMALAFPIVLILDITFIFLWFLISWKRAIVIIALSVGLLPAIKKTYNYSGGERAADSNLKLMTMNAYYFKKSPEKAKAFWEKEQPDVTLYQEMGTDIQQVLPDNEKLYFENYDIIGIVSKHPIVESKLLKSDDANVYICYADIKINKDTLRFINIYLSSVRISKGLVKETIDQDKFKGNSKTILGKLKTSFEKHQKEIKTVQRYIEKSPYPLVVAGDFNAVPNSYEYFKLGKGLKDAFLEGGEGLGTTFHSYKFPLKIDHVFLSDSIQVKDYKIVREPILSDHFPVIVELNYAPK